MQFQKKEKRQTTVRFDSHHVRLRTGEVQRKTGSYMYRWTDKLGKRNTIYAATLEAMLDYFETEHYVFTHGWIPSIPNRDKSYSYISSWREADREQWNQARWFNGMDAAQTADENKTIVCGHWHTSYGHSKYEHKGTEFGEDADFSPYYGPGIIAIDACTAFSGKVNCLVMED